MTDSSSSNAPDRNQGSEKLQVGSKSIYNNLNKSLNDLEEYCSGRLNKTLGVTNLSQIQQFIASIKNNFIEVLIDKEACQEKLIESQKREVEALKKTTKRSYGRRLKK